MSDALRARHDVRLLWAGQFIGDTGGQLTIFALPAIAVISLHASAWQLGALQAFEFGMVPVLAVVAGMLADRYPRKALMQAANAIRFVALLSIPLSWSLHALCLAQFYVAGALGAGASVLYDTAAFALLPTLCGRDEAPRWIGRFAMSGSAAEMVGSGTAGTIVQCFGGPVAILVNAVAQLVAMLGLAGVHVDEVRAPASRERLRRGDLVAGFAFVAREPVLRASTACAATAYLGGAMVSSVFALYCYRGLHFSPVQLGAVMGLANLGLIGGFSGRRLVARLGARRTLTGATLVGAIGKFAFLVHAAPLLAIFGGRLLLSLTGPIAATTCQNLQNARTPEALRGRAAAAARTITWGALPIGSLAGGAAATWAGIPTAIAVGAAISVAAVAWLAACPAMSRRNLDDGGVALQPIAIAA